MSRKKQRKSKRADLKRIIKTSEKRHWKVIIDSQEASANFYSLLSALQKEKGSGLINKKALRYVTRWINVIKKNDPDVEERSNDTRGPFRERDLSPFTFSLELDQRERELMLFLWKTMYIELTTRQTQDNWISSHGREDYESAVKNYQSWINSLEEEGYISENH